MKFIEEIKVKKTDEHESLEAYEKRLQKIHEDFQESLRELGRNAATYGVIEKEPGGYSFRLDNNKFKPGSKKYEMEP